MVFITVLSFEIIFVVKSLYRSRRAILIVICHCFSSRKTTKKPLIFFYHRLKAQVLSFYFRYIKDLRFVSADKKIRAFSVALNGLVLRTDFHPDYLIFSRFYLKNRITTKPTPKSRFFNDFNARRGIDTSDYNSMANDGNYPVRVHKRERTIGQHLHARYNERVNNARHLILSYLLLY